MGKALCPIITAIPGNLGRWVDLDRHDLRSPSALDDDHQCSETSGLPASLLASLDIFNDEWVADVGAGDDMGGSDGEAVVLLVRVENKEKSRHTDGVLRDADCCTKVQ